MLTRAGLCHEHEWVGVATSTPSFCSTRSDAGDDCWMHFNELEGSALGSALRLALSMVSRVDSSCSETQALKLTEQKKIVVRVKSLALNLVMVFSLLFAAAVWSDPHGGGSI